VVLSKQGEVLVAEADITEATIAEQIDLKATLASPELYQASKVPLPNSNGTPVTLQVQLLQRSNGRPYLKITSQQPINGNALDVLIDLRWAGGRMLRDFNLLIEESARNKPTATPPAVAGSSKRSADGQAINVKRGDTASEIAVQNNLPQGVSLDQMLLAMLRSNPDAFVDNNVNRLKAGVLLSMPTAEEAKQISREDARKEIVVQTQNFEAYRAELAARAPGGATPKASRDSEGKLQAQVQNKQNKANQDQLTLTKPNSKGSQEEEKIAKEREAIEAANKAEALTRNIEELGKIAAATAAASEAGVLPVAPPPAEAASADGTNWVDTLTQHPLAPVGAGGLIAVLVLLGLWARRSGRNHEEAEDDGIQGLPPLNVKFDLNLPHGDDFDGRHESPFAEQHGHADDASNSISMHEHEYGEHEQGEHHEHHNHGYEGATEHAQDTHHTHDDLHEDPHAHHAPETSRPTLDIPNTSHYAGAQEHPFQVRMDLAEELWKLGQLHTSRALMEEVANEASGEIQAQARQWLADRG
jgi:FimV-like protein